MPVRLVLLLTVLLVTACAGQSRQPAKADSAQFSEPPSYGWLDPDRTLYNELCLITLNGRDIRHSVYLEEHDAPRRIVLICRDYSDRQSGLPDSQSVVAIDPVAGQGSLLETKESDSPIAVVTNSDHSKAVLSLLSRTQKSERFEWGSSVVNVEADSTVTVAKLDYPVKAVNIRTDGTIACRQIKAVQLEGGLLAPATDWAAPLIEIAIDGRLLEYSGLDWLPGNGGSWHAGYTVNYSPLVPGAATFHLEIYDAIGQLHQFDAPYHASYSAFEWNPAVEITSETLIVMVGFMPEATGKSGKRGYSGVFRIKTLDPESGHEQLIEDHVERDLGIAVSHGVVFYTRREPGNADQWGVWASDCSGLKKRRLWLVKDSLYVAVADFSLSGELLIERQYFDEALGMPQLHSELREISLKPLHYKQGVNRELLVRSIVEGTLLEYAPGDIGRPPSITGVSGGTAVAGDEIPEGSGFREE